MIERERHGTVEVLRLAHGKASALDVEFCRALAGAVEECARSDARAAVLTGNGAIFSAGVDLKRIVAGGAEYVREFLPALDEALLALIRFAKPLVGAANGHAIAGGCAILCACDRRFVAQGNARFGVPELVVGVPFPLTALEIVREAVVPLHFSRLLLEGELVDVDGAVAAGVAHRVIGAEDLLGEALAIAERLARVPAASFAATKGLARLPLRERWERHGAASAAETLRVWSAPETLSAVRDYVERTLR